MGDAPEIARGVEDDRVPWGAKPMKKPPIRASRNRASNPQAHGLRRVRSRREAQVLVRCGACTTSRGGGTGAEPVGGGVGEASDSSTVAGAWLAAAGGSVGEGVSRGVCEGCAGCAGVSGTWWVA